MSDALSELKEMYPIFQFKNKTNTAQSVALFGDTVQVNPKGILKLRSSKFSNLPSTSAFQFIAPTLDDLRAVGLLASPSPAASVAKPKSTPVTNPPKKLDIVDEGDKE